MLCLADGTYASARQEATLSMVGLGPMVSVPQIHASAGKVLEGERYLRKSGTYSKPPGSGREVTLIEIEALQALSRDYKTDLGGADARRNVVPRGIALNHFV